MFKARCRTWSKIRQITFRSDLGSSFAILLFKFDLVRYRIWKYMDFKGLKLKYLFESQAFGT